MFNNEFFNRWEPLCLDTLDALLDKQNSCENSYFMFKAHIRQLVPLYERHYANKPERIALWLMACPEINNELDIHVIDDFVMGQDIEEALIVEYDDETKTLSEFLCDWSACIEIIGTAYDVLETSGNYDYLNYWIEKNW